MVRQYRVNRWARFINRRALKLVRRGWSKRTWSLTTTGHRSGELRTTPVSPIEVAGTRWLVGPYGSVGWVQNLRALPEGVLISGREEFRFRAVEAEPEVAGRVMAEYLRREKFVRPYVGLSPDDPIERFVASAERYPVFRVEPIPPA